MKKIFTKEKEKVVSPLVMRAIFRLNKYKYARRKVSTFWDGKAITKNLSITS